MIAKQKQIEMFLVRKSGFVAPEVDLMAAVIALAWVEDKMFFEDGRAQFFTDLMGADLDILALAHAHSPLYAETAKSAKRFEQLDLFIDEMKRVSSQKWRSSVVSF